MSEEPTFRSPFDAGCGSYAYGHMPHASQVLRCHMSPLEHWWRVVVLGVVGDVLTLAVDDELRRYRNHEAGYLASVVAELGPQGMLNDRYGVLFLRWPSGARSAFSLQRAEQPAGPCHPL